MKFLKQSQQEEGWEIVFLKKQKWGKSKAILQAKK